MNRLSCTVRVYQNLARLPRFQSLHRIREIFHRDPIGDCGVKIELARFEQRGHLIPGVVHSPAVNALHGDALKDDVFGEIQRDRL